MNWPDWFGRKAKASAEIALSSLRSQLEREQDRNLTIIHALREMDQGTFQISQVAPDWTRIQPIFKKMFEATEKRMATENNRIRNLVVGEIVTAYNGPPVDFRTLSKTKVLKIEDKS